MRTSLWGEGGWKLVLARGMRPSIVVVRFSHQVCLKNIGSDALARGDGRQGWVVQDRFLPRDPSSTRTRASNISLSVFLNLKTLTQTANDFRVVSCMMTRLQLGWCGAMKHRRHTSGINAILSRSLGLSSLVNCVVVL